MELQQRFEQFETELFNKSINLKLETAVLYDIISLLVNENTHLHNSTAPSTSGSHTPCNDPNIVIIFLSRNKILFSKFNLWIIIKGYYSLKEKKIK